jgi:hypothetical protein
MASCDRIEANAFRILRLSVRSNSSEIHSAAAAFRRMATMSIGNLSDADLPKVRAALGILNKTQQRIEHRLFWFHDPDSQAHWPAAVLDDIETQHDIALRMLLSAYSRECGETDGMPVALREWHRLISQPIYWEVLAGIEQQGAFEPPALSTELSGLREHAMALAAEPFEEAAEICWRSRDFSAVRSYFSNLKELGHTGDWTEACRRGLLDHMTGPLVDACDLLRKQYRTQMIYEDGAERRNEAICAGELQYYRSFIEPAWDAIAAAVPDEEAELWLSRGNIAECLAGIATDHTWTEQEALAQDLANEAITLARGSIVEAKLRAELSHLLGAGERRREEEANRAIAALKSAIETFHAKTAGSLGRDRRMSDPEAVTFFRETIRPALSSLSSKLPESDERTFLWRAEAARCLCKVAAYFLTTDEFSVVDELTRVAPGLTKGTGAELEIESEFARLRAAAEIVRRKKAHPRPDTAVERLRAHCAALSTVAVKIVLREGFSTENRLTCAEELDYFRTHLEPALLQALSELPPNATLSFELREEVAIRLGEIAVHHVWADERATAKTLMLQALRWAQGTWAEVSLKKKYLEIQDAVETPPSAEMSHEASPQRQIDRRIFISAGLVAILLAFAVVNRAELPTISATPQRTAGPSISAVVATPNSGPVPSRLDDIEQELAKLESQINAEKNHAATLEQQTNALQKEIVSLKVGRARGETISSEKLNLKLYKYSALQREIREVREAIDTHARQRVQMIAQRELSRK